MLAGDIKFRCPRCGKIKDQLWSQRVKLVEDDDIVTYVAVCFQCTEEMKSRPGTPQDVDPTEKNITKTD
jgi:hypothetical protein